MASISAIATPHVMVTVDRFDELEISVISCDDRTVLQVVGEMDVANADLLPALVAGELARGRRFVRLDVSRLAFCDCAGLRAIVQAHNALLRNRGTLVLVGVTARMARLLAVTGLHEALFIADGPGDPPRARSRGHLSAVEEPERRPRA